MKPLLFCSPGNEHLRDKLLTQADLEAGEAIFRRFPDGESYIRILSAVQGREVLLLSSLHQPDEKLLMLYFFARTAKVLGARSVTLLAPYLAYMRQDKAFHPGEAITSDLFADWLSEWVDALVTIDPHLHRHHDLGEIYRIPTTVLHAGPLVVDYIKHHIRNPILIGPDEESKQWVEATAQAVGCDFTVLKKERLGDREVRVSVPDAVRVRQFTPVLVDDIISTGRTMVETALHLREYGIPAPVCIGIHAVFAGDALEALYQSGIRQIITTNTIPHPTNALDVSQLLVDVLRREKVPSR
jgi:ribose-phosphate pyrophosphokinase